MSDNIKITGVPTAPGPNGSVPVRREVRDLQANSPDQYNVFLLGLRELQSMDEQQMQSYYQIAGIHGEPFKPWNNVKGIQNFQFGGYCTHSSVLFVPWHRPYLALFEQALYACVQAVAAKFPAGPLRDKYVAAAKLVRLPYWDWAIRGQATAPAFPAALAATTVNVVDIDGKTKNIRNPLHQFDFHPVNPAPGDFDSRWSRFKSTVRQPDANGNSRDDRISLILSNEMESLRRNVGLILLSYRDFNAFSDNQWAAGNPTGSFGSLEDMHNEIHDKTGGGGHMSSLETSAFDPLFWLHHCNVDRLWAMWQDLNPTAFITPKPAPMSTFSTQRGSLESQDSALSPFWDKSGTRFWAAKQVKDTTVFGYAYPETQKWKSSSQAAYQADLRAGIAKVYGGNVFSAFAETTAAQQKTQLVAVNKLAVMPQGAVPEKATDDKKPVVHVTAVEGDSPPVHEIHAGEVGHGEQKSLAAAAGGSPEGKSKSSPAGAGPIPASLAHLAPNNTYTEWIVNVRALKHVLGQTYRVIIFLGTINPDPTTWDLEYNCVGRVSVLGRSAATQCGKCQDDMSNDLSITGTVPLTSALLQDIAAGHLADLRAENVVPHLKRDLKWRVTLFEGEEKPVAEVQGLKVSVCSTQVKIGEDGMPQYSGEYTIHQEVTAGQPGGMGADEGH